MVQQNLSKVHPDHQVQEAPAVPKAQMVMLEDKVHLVRMVTHMVVLQDPRENQVWKDLLVTAMVEPRVREAILDPEVDQVTVDLRDPGVMKVTLQAIQAQQDLRVTEENQEAEDHQVTKVQRETLVDHMVELRVSQEMLDILEALEDQERREILAMEDQVR